VARRLALPSGSCGMEEPLGDDDGVELIKMCADKAAIATQMRLLARRYCAIIGTMAAPLVGLRPVGRALIMSSFTPTALATGLAAYLIASMALGGALGLCVGGYVARRLSRIRRWTRMRRAVIGMTAGLLPGVVYVGLIVFCLKAPDIIDQYYGIIIVAVVCLAASGIVVAERM
jgi:hypothetical protein